jgi:hypothetical protein
LLERIEPCQADRPGGRARLAQQQRQQLVAPATIRPDHSRRLACLDDQASDI